LGRALAGAASANATDFGGLLMSVLKLVAGGTPAADEIAQRFDHVLVLERGRIAEQGSFEQLKGSGGALQKLLKAV